MSTTIDSWFPWVLPYVPGATDLIAIQAIRSAANEFCILTDLVQRVITEDCTANVEDYTITPPTDMELSRVLSVSWQGKVLGPASPAQVMQDIVLRGAAVGSATPVSGNPMWFLQKTPTDSGFSLYPVPDTTLTLGLTVKASFNANNAATTLDDNLYADWVDEIAAGAISNLMGMPGQPFSNDKLMATYEREYRDGVRRARRQKNTGKLSIELRVAPRAFA